MQMLLRHHVLGLIVLLSFASSAVAGFVKITDGVGGLNGAEASGGAFTVNQISPSNGEMGGVGGSATSFATFCIERNEHIGFGQFYWTKIDSGAANGGYGGQTSPNFDPISSQTALLYRTFRSSGSIAGLPVITTANTTVNKQLASSLQYAIWRLEGELDSAYNNPNGSNSGLNKHATIIADADAMYNWAMTNATGGLYGVRVLQLYTGYNATTGFTGNSQDQLTLVPTPTAVTAGSVLLIGAAWISRRRGCAAG